MIAVIGGTGRLGSQVAKALARQGHTVRVIARKAPLRPWTEWPQIHGMAADARDLPALNQALANCRAVHVHLPEETTVTTKTGESPIALQAVENVLALSRKAQWHRITLLSKATMVGGNTRPGDSGSLRQAEQMLQNSGQAFAIVRASPIMESLAQWIGRGKVRVPGSSAKPFHWVAGEDVARLIARLHEPPMSSGLGLGRTLLALGPEGISLKAALHRYCAALHPEIRVATSPYWLSSALARWQHDSRRIQNLRDWRYLETVEEKTLGIDGFAMTGITPISLYAWLKSHRPVIWRPEPAPIAAGSLA